MPQGMYYTNDDIEKLKQTQLPTQPNVPLSSPVSQQTSNLKLEDKTGTLPNVSQDFLIQSSKGSNLQNPLDAEKKYADVTAQAGTYIPPISIVDTSKIKPDIVKSNILNKVIDKEINKNPDTKNLPPEKKDEIKQQAQDEGVGFNLEGIGNFLRRVAAGYADTMRGTPDRSTMKHVFELEKQELNKKYDDPNSEVSKGYQDLANRFIPDQDFSQYSYSEMSTMLPWLKEIENERLKNSLVGSQIAKNQAQAQSTRVKGGIVSGGGTLDRYNLGDYKITDPKQFDVQKYKTALKILPDVDGSLEAIRQMRELVEKSKLLQVPYTKVGGQIEAMKNSAIGKFRVAIAGPGTMTEQDKKQIQDTLPKYNSPFESYQSAIGKLDSLEKMIRGGADRTMSTLNYSREPVVNQTQPTTNKLFKVKLSNGKTYTNVTQDKLIQIAKSDPNADIEEMK